MDNIPEGEFIEMLGKPDIGQVQRKDGESFTSWHAGVYCQAILIHGTFSTVIKSNQDRWLWWILFSHKCRSDSSYASTSSGTWSSIRRPFELLCGSMEHALYGESDYNKWRSFGMILIDIIALRTFYWSAAFRQLHDNSSNSCAPDAGDGERCSTWEMASLGESDRW